MMELLVHHGKAAFQDSYGPRRCPEVTIQKTCEYDSMDMLLYILQCGRTQLR